MYAAALPAARLPLKVCFLELERTVCTPITVQIVLRLVQGCTNLNLHEQIRDSSFRESIREAKAA